MAELPNFPVEVPVQVNNDAAWIENFVIPVDEITPFLSQRIREDSRKAIVKTLSMAILQKCERPEKKHVEIVVRKLYEILGPELTNKAGKSKIGMGQGELVQQIIITCNNLRAGPGRNINF